MSFLFKKNNKSFNETPLFKRNRDFHVLTVQAKNRFDFVDERNTSKYLNGF